MLDRQSESFKQWNRDYQKEYRKLHKDSLNSRIRESRRANPSKKYFEELKSHYGVTKDWFYAQMQKQEDKCLCGFVFELFTGNRNKSPHVDHCHKTNKVRGLLCFRCNTAIGLLRLEERSVEESLTFFTKLMSYLRE